MTKMILNLLKLLRWQNLLIIIVTQYLTALCLVKNQDTLAILTDFNLLFLSLSTVLIAAAGYVINDYYDIKIDYVNRPDRVVVGRFLKRRSILFTHAGLNFIGIGLAFLISWQIGLINFIAAGLLWFYSNQLKRLALLGNILIGLLTGLAVMVIYVLYRESLFLISAYAFFAFFISLIREIIKDLEDIEGDKKFGCKTLPILIGQRRTKGVIYFIALIFLTVVTILLQEEPKFWYVLSGLTLMLTLLIYKLVIADKTRDFAKLSTISKQIMILGIISMIFLR